MKSLASLALILAVPAAAQEPPAGDGPRGSSQLAAGETRYDAVGRADVGAMPGVAIATSGLPVGGYAEVTALDTGRTIVALVAAGDVPPRRIALLSPAAVAELGTGTTPIAVRVRQSAASPPEIALLRSGQPAARRVDAPSALLAALRKKLAPEPAAVTAANVTVAPPKPRPTPAAPAPKPVTKPTPIRSGYVVQIAAVSSATRAAALARALGGSVLAGPPVWRVRLGPFADAAGAAKAKADVARRGYPGATVLRFP